VQLRVKALWRPFLQQARVGAGSIRSPQDLWEGCIRPNLGLSMPGLPAILDGSQTHVRSIQLRPDHRSAVVVCTSQEVRDR
jgi:hypothetical protein